MKSFYLFFCERNISPLLKKHLGKHFYEKKKFPYPVSFEEINDEGVLDQEKFRTLINNLREESTYLHIGNGAELTLKIGRVHTNDNLDVVKNVLRAMKELLILFKELGLSKNNIRRIYLKTEKSESLPVFTHLSEEEIQLAKEMGKKIIAVQPWGAEKTSTVVKNNADRVITWNSRSLVNAIKEL